VLERSQAYAAENGIEQLWDFVDAEKVIDFYGVSDDGSKVLYEETAYAPNGEKVPSGKFVFTDLATGTQTSLNNLEETTFYTASVSPDGKWITAATFSPSSRLLVFDTQSLSSTPRSVNFDEATSPQVGRMLWHPESTRIALTKHNTGAMASMDVATLSFGADITTQSYNDLELTTVYEGVDSNVVMNWAGDVLMLNRNDGSPSNLIQTQSFGNGRTACLNSISSLPKAGNSLRIKLPFERGQTMVSQDYCGTFSHGAVNGGNWATALDFTANTANTSISNFGDPVLAVASGTVERVVSFYSDAPNCSSNNSSAMNLVEVRHASGYSSHYWHLSGPGNIPVSRGQTVSMGTPLGEVGCSGFVRGAHLHFHMTRYGGKAIPEPIDGYTNLQNRVSQPIYSTNQSNASLAPRLENLHIRVGSGSWTDYRDLRNREIPRSTPIDIDATVTNPHGSSISYYYVVALRQPNGTVSPIWDDGRNLPGRYILRAFQTNRRIEVGNKDQIKSSAGSGYALALYYGDSPDLSNFPNGFTQFDTDKPIRIVEPTSGGGSGSGGTTTLPNSIVRLFTPGQYGYSSDYVILFFRPPSTQAPFYRVYWNLNRTFDSNRVVNTYFEGRYSGVALRLSDFFIGREVCFWTSAHATQSPTPRSNIAGPECTRFPMPSGRSRSLDGGNDELILPDNLELFELDVGE
jgi:hypothetical protein